jgi:hypothetical protein
MKRVAQSPHELAGQALTTLAAYLARLFWLCGYLLLLRVGRRARGRFGAAVRRERVYGRGVVLAGAAPRQAVAARVEAMLLRGSRTV